jgi:hypothetical protein
MYSNENSNLKEALQYLVGLGETKILEVEGKKFSTNQMYPVKEPKPAQITATTLTALVDYLKSGIDKKWSERLLIHIVSPSEVILFSELRDDQDRESYIKCTALTPDNIVFDRFINTENFNIMLQSSFVGNEDRSLLLKVVGTIQDKAVKEVGDDGVSQAVTIKTGVAQVGNVKVPNPVILAPYRTFPEIKQPESKFIFRMQTGPAAALFEADGGAWRNKAMEDIKDFLANELKGLSGIEIIS